jgi:hypothetical protein
MKTKLENIMLENVTCEYPLPSISPEPLAREYIQSLP